MRVIEHEDLKVGRPVHYLAVDVGIVFGLKVQEAAVSM
jgi:hypothetical protein